MQASGKVAGRLGKVAAGGTLALVIAAELSLAAWSIGMKNRERDVFYRKGPQAESIMALMRSRKEFDASQRDWAAMAVFSAFLGAASLAGAAIVYKQSGKQD